MKKNITKQTKSSNRRAIRRNDVQEKPMTITGRLEDLKEYYRSIFAKENPDIADLEILDDIKYQADEIIYDKKQPAEIRLKAADIAIRIIDFKLALATGLEPTKFDDEDDQVEEE